MLEYILLIIGLIVLVIGGDVLVRGAVGLAEKLAVPPLIIGLTIVSFGTSTPELLVSVSAALEGFGGISIGNVVGSNIANVLLVLGMPAMIKATLCDEDGIGRNLVACIGITIVFMGMLYAGYLSRIDGLILLSLLFLFFYDQFRRAMKARAESEDDDEPNYLEEVENHPTTYPVILVMMAIGLVMLPIGAELTVDAATTIAKRWHVSDEVIGLTIVAFGTSLPELATTLMAVFRNSSSVALGNIVGSNILNIVAIMGITTLIAPIKVGENIIKFDMWIMLAAILLLAFLAHYRITVGKRAGGAMIFAYIVYVITVYNM